jgi:hypothetical protein
VKGEQNMQAGKSKQIRQETAGLRKELRPAARVTRRENQKTDRAVRKVIVLRNEDRKRIAAMPSSIAEVNAAYILQCANRRAEKAAERKSKSTIPAEAVTNETR